MLQKRRLYPKNDIFLPAEVAIVKKYTGNHPENKKKLRTILINIIRRMVTEGQQTKSGLYQWNDISTTPDWLK